MEGSDTNVKPAITPLRWANWAKSSRRRFCEWSYSYTWRVWVFGG